ncbi:MAG TPA: proline/glycine betaine ABC transporter permease [Burkholderiaceae bacterium]|jgi:glycine betaine/proline transport system permease protein|nr:proline/glycine betaine ABC transporter permease [Burkholderiaceae bacterium]HPH13267.1 proline/glycine betaine ABC transporter permease [Burkholderiaceae bacterium]
MSEFLPLGEWVDRGVKFVIDNDGGTLERLGSGIGTMTEGIELALQAVPVWMVTAIFVLTGFWRVGWKFALFCLACCMVIDGTGFWPQTMVTLALIIAATVISLIIGLPLGIWVARNDRVAAVVRPTLDFMQTMPAFVYLIPAAMLFGLGRVPGVLATVIFAMPPVVRLTSLGIRQVNKEQVEAGVTFGCTPMQVLLKVQIPGALPSIMAGINQTIMMALSMVIIASMVGAGGLGNDVLASIQRLDIGLGFESGLAVVLLAIMLDRITETVGAQRPRQSLRDRLGLPAKKDRT